MRERRYKKIQKKQAPMRKAYLQVGVVQSTGRDSTSNRVLQKATAHHTAQDLRAGANARTTAASAAIVMQRGRMQR